MMNMYTKIERCRICGNNRLEQVLDLGSQMLTGVFPRTISEEITQGPLRLVKCTGGADICGLLQLEHSYDLAEMYGNNYGYRSGLNASMVEHLHDAVNRILRSVSLVPGDLVVDIGSNDCTTLRAYPSDGPTLVGIDPTGAKYSSYYPPHVQLIPEFFSPSLLQSRFSGKKAKVITSFSMFYDLEDPMAFMSEIREILGDDGVWIFEQSYMPAMLQMNSFDTICHEHLEYYSLRQIKWMTDRVGFRIEDVTFSDTNGGSFAVTVSKALDKTGVAPVVQEILDEEQRQGLSSPDPYNVFSRNIQKTKDDLLHFVDGARKNGKTVAALGASTKGNVLLQYCGLTKNHIRYVGEVNVEKFGCLTPGSWIEIVPEDQVIGGKFDYLIVLPWHFRKSFVGNARLNSETLVFPLPELEIVKI